MTKKRWIFTFQFPYTVAGAKGPSNEHSQVLMWHLKECGCRRINTSTFKFASVSQFALGSWSGVCVSCCIGI